MKLNAPHVLAPSRGQTISENLIDVVHYSHAAKQKFSNQFDAYTHFRHEGQKAGLNPSPWFATDWYAWQNLECRKFKTVLDHFASKATRHCVDPAPFIDMVALLRRFPEAGDALGLYRMLLTGQISDVTSDPTAYFALLKANRDAFTAQIDLRVLRDTGGGRKRLIWVQCGRAFRPAKWFEPSRRRSWDLLCNWYDLAFLDLRWGETILRQSGTKFTGIAKVLRVAPELLNRYDQILFIDDDLGFRHSEIDTVFDLAEKNTLDLFQPTLQPGSHCVWPDLFSQPGRDVRLSTGVEIMMFGFSQRALKLCEVFFDSTVSGFGLDLTCSQAVRTQGWNCGFIDAVGVEHLDEIDEKGGSYYEFMRRFGINPKLELYEAMMRLGAKPNLRALNKSEMAGTPLSKC